MLFIAFNLDDFHKESGRGGVRFRFVSARSLKQAYARSWVLTEAHRRGYKVHEKRTPQGLQLTLSKCRS